MSPAVGQQNVAMPPRPSSSQPDGAARGAPCPSGAPPAQYPPPHGYKPAPGYPPAPYSAYPPRNHLPYPPHAAPYPPYRHPHYLKQQQQHLGHKMGPPPPAPPTDPPDNGGPPSATALVTTGPDGAPLDEASQQSTLSNASAASGEDSSSNTPKPRKEFGGAGASPAPPHDDYDASPSAWPRPPSSPVFNTHVQPESFRTKKSDSLGKLYEMDDSPDRRGWVEQLLGFMEDRRTPIAACPTISKQPLDLYRLYLLVKDRGGFLEVTKNKTWKDIAGLLGIGASSSAAYTLRKHYTKNLLAFECHFDRGGVDPQPIINQVEASTKKKNNKANSAPSPGTSNSTESYAAGAPSSQPGAPMDGYGSQYGAYPPPPASQPQGYQQGYAGYDYNSPYGPSRPVYQYGPEGDRGYGGYGGGYGGRYPPPPGPPGGPAPPAPPPGGPAPPAAGTPPPVQSYPDYYRPPQPPPPASPAAQPPPHEYGGKGQMPPPASGQPRRHPDFAKEGGYTGPAPPPGVPGAPPRPPPSQYPGWTPPPPGQLARPPGAPPAPWRPPQSQPQPWPAAPYQTQGQPTQWAGSAGGVPPRAVRPPPPPPPPPGTPPRPAAPPSPYHRPDGKPYPPHQQQPGVCASGGVKREMMFPHDSVEATVPVAEKRRRLTRADVAPVDAWRIMMALKSGLLAETSWALDVLNILLFDDSSVGYFGLQHLPGLLDLLLEHFQKSLSDVFEAPPADDEPWWAVPTRPAQDTEPTPTPVPPDPSERLTVLSGENYTMQSRRGRPVTVRTRDDDYPPDMSDEDRVDDAALEPWQFGGEGSFSNHVMPCFQAEFNHIPFTRIMEPPPRREALPPPPAPRSPLEEPPDRVSSPAVAPPARPVETHAPPREDADNLESEPMEVEGETQDRRIELQIRDPAGTLRRRTLSHYEDESIARDEPSLNLLSESKDALSRRCIALSNILRGLTFVPGNETEFSRSSAFLVLAGKLLLLHHEHAPRAARARAYERAARDDADSDACCTSLTDGSGAWWGDALEVVRSDVLVCCANIAGCVELAGQPEAVARPLLDGLLHWCVCPAAGAEDAPPHAPPSSPLSPRRLALEALCKLCVTDANVDLVLATPPRSRLRALCAVLARNLCRHEEPVLREFSVNLLHYLAAADSGAAREVALQAPAVSQLVAFIERAEQAALGVANQHGVGALRDNPDAMGTSLDMLRRAAAALLRLAEHPHNRPLFVQQERRLLALVMSQILDQKVAQELAKVLFQCSRAHRPPTTNTTTTTSCT